MSEASALDGAAPPAGSPGDGLTATEVAERVRLGQTNAADDRSSRSIASILRENTLTLFNLILSIALVLVLSTGRWPDAAFGLVMVVNIAIGVGTEYRAKRTLDRLAILSAARARVLRNGKEQPVAVADVVLDDVVRVAAGDQIPADGDLLSGTSLEVDESLLTGESRPVRKTGGDELLSGSAVLAGSALYRVTRVGADGYANRLTAQAKRYSTVRSELQEGINRILRYVSMVIVPIALLLFWSQLRTNGGWSVAIGGEGWKDAVTAAVAGVVGMIPEGLVLLTSLNFALAAIVLARQKVLVQELAAVEVLARVDVLCLDKTGTITDGSVELSQIVELPGSDRAQVRAALAALAGADGGNATSQALADGLAEVDAPVVLEAVPFSSARKWSAILASGGSGQPSQAWVLGAPEILLAQRDDWAATRTLATASERAASGARVVAIARAAKMPDPDAPLAADLEPAALAVLSERVRPDAMQTLEYFRQQGVQAKVISGDNPQTVKAIAQQVRLRGRDQVRAFDARHLPEDTAELSTVLDGHDVFGRVVPEQKRAIVQALQSRGHVVAMTGDGVNDSLALKDADLGIAMGDGAAATKAVARLVLLDGRFATLPGVLGQGRRVMANMERVATLFLTKTTYSALLALVTVVLALSYPLLPRHLTLVSALTIGIPAFFLAIPPNDARYRSGFLPRVLRFAMPSGVVVGIGVLVTFLVLRHDGEALEAGRTAATVLLLAIGFWIVGILARPLRPWKVVLIAALVVAAAGAFSVPLVRHFFELETLDAGTWGATAVAVLVGWAVVEGIHRVLNRWRRHEVS